MRIPGSEIFIVSVQRREFTCSNEVTRGNFCKVVSTDLRKKDGSSKTNKE